MAHKKGQGSIRNGRDSNAQFRKEKKYGGEHVVAGNIIIRQVGNRYRPGRGVGQGKDFTLYALQEGTIRFYKRGPDKRSYVAVEPIADLAAAE